jgi:hypothetical protein
MDEKDKFDGIDGEQEEAVYVARHARQDEEEDRFADVENFDVDSTEPESVQDGTEGKDDYTDSYGDDFNFQSVASKKHIPSDNPSKSNKDYGDDFDGQTGEHRHDHKCRKPGNDDYYVNDFHINRHKGKNKKSKKKNNKATLICIVVAVAVILVCVIAFVLSKCSFQNKKPETTTVPTTKAAITTQQPTTEYYEPETEPEYVPDYTEYVEETTEQPYTEEYTEPETEPYTEEYTEPETYEPTPDTEPVTEYVPDETTQIV